MKVEFMSEEIKELADLLAGEDRELIFEIARSVHGEFKHELQHKEHFVTSLQDKVTQSKTDFTGDELDYLRAMLEHHELMLTTEISRTDHREYKHKLQARFDRIVQLRKKIAELCAAA